MKLLEEFVKKVRKETGSFEIRTSESGMKDERYNFFMQAKVGKARFVYGAYSWSENFQAQINLKPELIAIVADDIVYIVDGFFMGIYLICNKGKELPENTVIFDSFVKEKNDLIRNVVFKIFYDDLKTEEITDEAYIASIRKKARQKMLSLSAEEEEIILDPFFKENDVAKYLCGFIELDGEAYSILKKEKQKWINHKSIEAKMKELMQDPSTVSEWEMEIVKAIRNVNAKTVLVDFELNGNTATVTVSTETLLRMLQENDYFSEWDFENRAHGKKVLNELNAGKFYNDENALRCKHIKKITYRKKELFVRK